MKSHDPTVAVIGKGPQWCLMADRIPRRWDEWQMGCWNGRNGTGECWRFQHISRPDLSKSTTRRPNNTEHLTHIDPLDFIEMRGSISCVLIYFSAFRPLCNLTVCYGKPPCWKTVSSQIKWIQTVHCPQLIQTTAQTLFVPRRRCVSNPESEHHQIGKPSALNHKALNLKNNWKPKRITPKPQF